MAKTFQYFILLFNIEFYLFDYFFYFGSPSGRRIGFIFIFKYLKEKQNWFPTHLNKFIAFRGYKLFFVTIDDTFFKKYNLFVSNYSAT